MRSGLNGERTEPARDVTVQELAQAADALFFALRRARSAIADRIGGLSLAQYTLLQPLAGAGQPRIPVGQLAAGADVSVPTATRMLKQLEAKGVVLRQRSAQDERQVLVSLTEDGAFRLARLQESQRARQARAFDAFTPDERVQLVTLTRRLTELVAAADRVDPDHETDG
jgi:MarR family transcriptional regulator, organic hydroperoxide resistance regulator